MRSVVIGTAGHIDHGKSALVEALTGSDPDRLKEEKARGITIDLGFAHAAVGAFDLAFVDVPGHERFVKNMLAGVGGIDAVLLVIAADESVMPQTREHFAICRLLQIPAGLVALTKSDLVDADTLELARLDARELVAGSALADAPIVAVSAKTGDGLDALREGLAAIAARAPERAGDGPPRLPIDRVFSMRGFGTVVTGTLTSGTLRADDELVVLPAGRRVKVRGLQVHGAAQPSAAAGRRVAVNLGGVEVADLTRGDTLTSSDAFEVTRRFDAVIDLLPDAKPLRHGARVRFHHGTTELLGRVALAAEATERGDRSATENTESTDRSAATENTESTDRSAATENTESTDRSAATENTESTDRSAATENTERTDRSAATENTESTDRSAATENTESTDRSAATENTESTDRSAATENMESTDRSAATENTESTDRSAATENTESTDRSAATESTDITDRSVATGKTEGTDRKSGSAGLTELLPGRRAFARVRLEAPAVLTRGDRFILRQYSPAITIAGGRVLDPSPARTPIRTPAGAARFARLQASDADAVRAFVEERRGAGLTLSSLARRAGLTPAAVTAVSGELVKAGTLRVVGSEVFSEAIVAALEQKLLAAIAEHHRARAMSEGLPREEARERLFGHASAALFEDVLRRLAAQGQIAGRDRLAQPGRTMSLSPEEARAQEGLDRVFRDAGLAPPDVAAAAASAGVTGPVADRVAKLLIRQKLLVKVDTLLFHASALDRLKQEVKALKGEGGPAKVDVAGFKERYGISRKYAIPLLEWLDRERVTRRVGDARMIL